MMALVVITIIIAVFAVLFTIPVSCEFYLRYSDEIEKSLILKYGFIKIRMPKGKPEKKSAPQADRVKKKSDSAKKLIGFGRENIKAVKDMIYAILGYMFKHLVTINRLRIKFVFGVDDAMETALIFGAVSAFVFNVIGVMDRKMRLKKHITEIKPAFDNPHIFAECEAKISTSIGRAIVLAIIALRHTVPLLIKFRKSNKGSDTREEN